VSEPISALRGAEALVKHGAKAVGLASATVDAATSYMLGEKVGYETNGVFSADYWKKTVMEYFTDPKFSDQLSAPAMKRLDSGEGTESDVKGFLDSISGTKEYSEMGCSDPKDFINRVKGKSDSSYTGRASDRSRNGTGVREGKRTFLDTIHERNAQTNNAGNE
jgi:hypothetical protein